MIDLFNTYANSFLALFTLILVIATVVYASLTYKMLKIAKSQIVADINISAIVINSCLESKKQAHEDKNFLEKIKDSEGELNEIFSFNAKFDVTNKSAGNGSISIPALIIKFKSSNFEYYINPEVEEVNMSGDAMSGNMEIERKALDETIYLRGGDYRKIKTSYRSYLTQNNVDYFNAFIDAVKEEKVGFEYYLKFKDSIGKIIFKKAGRVRGE